MAIGVAGSGSSLGAATAQATAVPCSQGVVLDTQEWTREIELVLEP